MASSEYFLNGQFISEEDLKETECLLKNIKSFQLQATSHYKAWVEQREKSIEAIGSLEKDLENLHWACNTAHGIGSAMEAVGGLAMIAGAILTASGHESAGEFLTKKVSPTSTVTGVATTMTSSMAEIGLTHKLMNEVKMVLKRDEECTKILMENLKHSKKIDSYLRRIFDCNIWSNTFLDVVRLCQEGISLLDAGVMEISKLMNELKQKASKYPDISDCIDEVIQNVRATMQKISTDPKVRKAIRNICEIIQQSPSTVEFIKLGLRISFQVCDILNVDIITSILGFGVLNTSAGLMTTKCLLDTVLIAVNVLSVISAVQDAKEGTSKYSKMLKELNLALALELNTVRKNYPKLIKNNVRWDI